MENNDEIYEQILNDEEFINSVWNQFDATTKIGILEKSGVELVEEYEAYQLRQLR